MPSTYAKYHCLRPSLVREKIIFIEFLKCPGKPEKFYKNWPAKRRKTPKYVLENHEKCPGMSWNCPGIGFKKVVGHPDNRASAENN